MSEDLAPEAKDAEVSVEPQWIIDKPTCERDHLKNLAVFLARMPVEMTERMFLSRWKIPHRQFVRYLNRPFFWKLLRQELVHMKLLSRYPNMIESIANRAEKGDWFAAKSLLEELRVNKDAEKKEKEKSITMEVSLRELGRTIAESLTRPAKP